MRKYRSDGMSTRREFIKSGVCAAGAAASGCVGRGFNGCRRENDLHLFARIRRTPHAHGHFALENHAVRERSGELDFGLRGERRENGRCDHEFLHHISFLQLQMTSLTYFSFTVRQSTRQNAESGIANSNPRNDWNTALQNTNEKMTPAKPSPVRLPWMSGVIAYPSANCPHAQTQVTPTSLSVLPPSPKNASKSATGRQITVPRSGTRFTTPSRTVNKDEDGNGKMCRQSYLKYR